MIARSDILDFKEANKRGLYYSACINGTARIR